MATSRRFFILAVGLLFTPAALTSITEWDSRSVGDGENVKTFNDEADHDIKEIMDKKYETVHGRILAVNLAHVRKRSVLENDTESENDNATENAFQRIEKTNKELLNRFYQGDIVFEPDDSDLEEYIKSGGKSKNAVRRRKLLWTNRIIPYHVPYKMRHIAANVQAAVNEFHRKTCLRFVRYNSRYHRNYITFDNDYGCSSRIGKRYSVQARQKISIGPGCNSVPTIIHEMMHAIGFFHEQSRSDRDRYVKIYWENILKGFKDQFDKYSWITIDELGVSYDYQSIMHYDRRAFTKNGKPTIVAIGNENMEFKSPDLRLSARDVVEINALYDCQTQSYGWTKWSGWTPCDKNCYRTRERYCYHSGNAKSCGGNVNDYGVEQESAKCSPSICPAPIDGGWSRWSDWGDCSKTCNDGVKTRLRRCIKPVPRHGGKPCRGRAKEKAMCILKRCILGSDDADFENFRLGMWTNSRNDDLNWQFKKGYTQTAHTGPLEDHTTGKGYYLYVESSYTRPGQRAWLVSPWQAAPTDGKCLKFYYTMYGSTMGSLGIFLELSDGRKWYIFYKKGNQGKDWKKATGNIDPPPHLSYRLRVEAKIGQSGYSDIAIDDVFIDPGLCNCQDDFFTCHIWAAKGECTANSVWMKRNCKRSCKICRTAATAPPPITQTTKTCQDDAKFKIQCPLWGKNRECKKNPNWMLKNCKKTCNVCREDLTCADRDSQCPIWATWGACHKNPAWMLPNCKLSCKQCK